MNLSARLAKIEAATAGVGFGYIVHVSESDESVAGMTREEITAAQKAEARERLQEGGFKLGPKDMLILIRDFCDAPREDVGRFKIVR